VSKILVVDDDPTTRHLITHQLRRAGYTVAEAADGPKALERVRREPFDLVMLDVWMPELDGLEVLARLCQEPKPPRVVMMTADDASDTLLRAIRQQAYSYLTKPVEPKQLLEAVRSALEAGPELRPIEVVSARPDWVELLVPCQRESAQRIREFLAHLDADLPEEVRSGVGQAFGELLMNAIEWGGKLDPTKSVRISYLRARRMLLYRIADPGQGFSFDALTHAALANPQDKPTEHMKVREGKGLRPGGFGLLMARQLVDELLYNEKQNEVVFVKYLD
jgi:CheY-like chemotaxis protein/anti-sigma regulatory factor (Ser/Thr protein kinase)